eukprot:scaffold38698_cov57-Phaeocystis_antarctica.AAC.1
MAAMAPARGWRHVAARARPVSPSSLAAQQYVMCTHVFQPAGSSPRCSRCRIVERQCQSIVFESPKSTTTLSPGRRGGATARSALGWYRPNSGSTSSARTTQTSVGDGVPETLDGRPSGFSSRGRNGATTPHSSARGSPASTRTTTVRSKGGQPRCRVFPVYPTNFIDLARKCAHACFTSPKAGSAR